MSGIFNLGNTCWLNSMMQFLSSSDHFNRLLDEAETEEQNIIKNEFHAFKNSPTIYTPSREFISLMSRFDKGHSQKCADEAMFLMFDAMPKKFRIAFYAIYFDIAKCQNINCLNTIKRRYGGSFVIVPQTDDINKFIITHTSKSDERCTCGSPRDVFSCLDYLGDVLILNINKNTNLTLPNHLTFKMNKQDVQYELKATIEHSGNHLGGHYWARGKRGNSIFLFNDSSTVSCGDLQPRDTTVVVLYEKINKL